MKLRYIVACTFTAHMLLRFLRVFHVIGSEFDILIGWVSTISLILLGAFMGVAISEKKIQVRGMIASILLFSVGFLAAPFVGIGILILAEALPIRVNAGIIFGGSITIYLFLYMFLWFWLKKKGVIKFGMMEDDRET